MSIQDVRKLNEIIAEPFLDEEAAIAQDDYYYYDTHFTRKDLMSEADAHFKLIKYLVTLLEWYYRLENCYIGANINVYQDPGKNQKPISPDVMLVKNLVLAREERRKLKSWKMRLKNRPAPTVVFEISLGKTWREDLEQKPAQYLKLGVKEYFSYDPNDPTVWRIEPRQRAIVRLRGWSYKNGQIEEIQLNERGWLWSEELDSWLVPDEEFLRLYDLAGRRRLTGEETAQAKLRELGIDPASL